MKLINLRLIDEPLSIYIEADAHTWDLHNAFALKGVSQNLSERSVSLLWQCSGYGELPLPVEGAEIVFAGVDYFEITPRDPAIPDFGEDSCLAGLSRVPSEVDTLTLIAQGGPLLNSESEEELFHLWFAFRGGQCIRVGAETATFRIKSGDRLI